MIWKKLSSFPDQRIIGNYGIEFWAIRENKVWHQGRKLTNANYETFEIFDNQNFIARDQSYIYHGWSRLPKIDRDSFTKTGTYWTDKNSVYFEHETSLKILKDSDAKSFRYLGGSYGADDHSAWYYGSKLKSCTNSSSLVVVKNNELYAKDDNTVYFDGKTLDGVDASQWTILNTDSYSSDGKNVYFAERKLPRVDIKSWQHIYKTCSKDKNHVFHMNFIEKDIFSETFDKYQAIKIYERN
jgi:hypothetical protein